MKTTAKAPANIAFIKYWGKTDPKTRIPKNNSISMNLSDLYSICTIDFDKKYDTDLVEFIGEKTVKENELNRIKKVLDRVRSISGSNLFAKVVTQNNFPKATGIASSASGFAALSLAALSALNVKLSERELSIFARLGSGTACRSIPDGFVEWEKGHSSDTSFARQIYRPEYWDISDVVAIVTDEMKKVGSTEGHAISDTSPFYETRINEMDNKVKKIKQLIKGKNFTEFGILIEAEALNMHAICLTSTPSLIYWEPTTIEIMKSIIKWRENNDVESYFTIDAGPSVHVICRKKDAAEIKSRLVKIPRVQKVVINYPGRGARVINKHLFN